MAGLALIVWHELGSGDLLGEFFALCVVFSLGGYFTVLRSGRAANPLPALVIAGLLSSAMAAVFAGSLALAPASVPYAVLLGLVVMPVSFALISIGPRYLPAADVSLVMLLEAVLAGLWAWWILNEVPAVNVLVGGGVVLASVALRAAAERFRQAP
jgi:drug/metabolite transporter (DMT)-like permease